MKKNDRRKFQRLDNSERRGFGRLREDFNIKIDFQEKKDILPFEVGKSIDVSASGLQLIVGLEIPVDSIVDVKFIKPNSFDFFQNKARVAWVEKHPDKDNVFEMGIEFIDLNQVDQGVLDFYLHTEDPQSQEF